MGRRKTTVVVQGPSQAELDQRERQFQEEQARLRSEQERQASLQQQQLDIANRQAEEQRNSLARQERSQTASQRGGLISQRLAADQTTIQQSLGADQAKSIEQAQTAQGSRASSRTAKEQALEQQGRSGVLSGFLLQRKSRGLI